MASGSIRLVLTRYAIIMTTRFQHQIIYVDERANVLSLAVFTLTLFSLQPRIKTVPELASLIAKDNIAK